MCDPATLAVASLTLGAVSAGVSAYGAMQQGKAQEKQYQYQAAVNRNNAIIQNRLADDAIKRGEAAEAEHRRKVNQVKGSQRASFAANGIDLGSDIVSDTLSDTALLGELDALTIRNNAEREAYGYRVGAMNQEASAINNEAAGSNARSAGNLDAFGTILGGASTISGDYAAFKDKGVL